jgi:hypothetical protein
MVIDSKESQDTERIGKGCERTWSLVRGGVWLLYGRHSLDGYVIEAEAGGYSPQRQA